MLSREVTTGISLGRKSKVHCQLRQSRRATAGTLFQQPRSRLALPFIFALRLIRHHRVPHVLENRQKPHRREERLSPHLFAVYFAFRAY